jgi:hypothetical protein
MLKPKKKNSKVNYNDVIRALVNKAMLQLSQEVDQQVLKLMYKHEDRDK